MPSRLLFARAARLVAAFALSLASASCSSATGTDSSVSFANNNSAQAAFDQQICGPAGATKVHLLTPSIANGARGNYIEYGVSVTSCSGDPQPLSAAAILFDVDGVNSNAVLPLAFTAEASQGASESGHMLSISGSDLFGRTGPSYYHYATDHNFSPQGASASMVLHINLEGMDMQPNPSPLITGPAQLVTYLRFGAATADSAVVQLNR